MPTITVITVCFNAEKYIEQTIKSVLEQKNIAIEYILIDGGSSDTTLDIIKRYEPSIDRYISEPDKGIADAMNKGIALATGDYILFLHADDYFKDSHVVFEASKLMQGKSDIYAFDILFKKGNRFLRKTTKKLGVRTYFKTPVMHQGAFCKKELLEKLGGFNTSFKIALDYDFFLRAYKIGASMEIHQQVLSIMRDTGVSSKQDWASLKQRFMEERKAQQGAQPTALLRVIYSLYWMMYLPYRKVVYVKNRLLSVV
ncbi:MAG: glycosyltransferase family 2 protein [Cycloclasticus sp.]|nr:glycosyltransferase family 2 protein [Cycloclasticus sp.]